MKIKGEFMNINDCNPFLRAAMIQPAVLEGCTPRIAYDYRIFLILDGKGKIILNGEEIQLNEGKLIIFAPGEEYYFSGKMKVAVLNFDMTRCCSLRIHPIEPPQKQLYLRELIFDITKVTGFENPIILSIDENVKADILGIVDVFVKGGEFCDAHCSALLKLLFVNILINRNERKTEQKILAENILCYIRSSAAEIPDNEELSKIFGYHKYYLASIFKTETGKTLHNAILEEKLKLACRWLTLTNRSIEDIAIDTGFSSRNYFCTTFKKHYGVTPLKYRCKVF